MVKLSSLIGGLTMPRSLTIRKLKAVEIRHLHNLLEGPLSAWQKRRAEAILLYAVGMNAVEITQVLEAHPNTVCADLRAFNHHGLNSIQQLRSRGAPVRISETQVAEILHLAQIPPYELGLPYGRWSVAKLRHYLIKHHVVRAISGEHLRRILKKGACAFVESGARP
jgi:transposase